MGQLNFVQRLQIENQKGCIRCIGKSYLGPAEIGSCSSRDLSRSNKHDTFWHVVLSEYFYVLVL